MVLVLLGVGDLVVMVGNRGRCRSVLDCLCLTRAAKKYGKMVSRKADTVQHVESVRALTYVVGSKLVTVDPVAER